MLDGNVAVFLDRDGVLNKDERGHIYKIEDFELLPGVIEGLKKLQNHYSLIIVTNQSGIGKGLYNLEDYKRFREHMHKAFEKEGIKITKEYFCKHHPESPTEEYRKVCNNRKPGTGMFQRASKQYNIDLSNSWMIGDKPTDIEAGLKIGAKTIGIPSYESTKEELVKAGANYVVNNLNEAADVILRGKIMQLFINAGGKGTRLYPLTKEVPKSMIPILGKPVLHHLVDWAKGNEITEIIMMNGHLSEQIVDYFGNGKKFGISIKHSIENESLGTGGALKLAEKHVKGTFCYINGDSVTNVNLKKVIEFHKKNNADITVVLIKTKRDDVDSLQLDGINITKFVKKDDDKSKNEKLTNVGLCVMEPKTLSLTDEKIFNFEHEIYPKLIRQGFKFLGYVTNEFIEDMGTPERLKKVEEILRN